MEAEKEIYLTKIETTLTELALLGYDLRERGGGIEKLAAKFATVFQHSRFSIQYSFADETLIIEETEEAVGQPTKDRQALLGALVAEEG